MKHLKDFVQNVKLEYQKVIDMQEDGKNVSEEVVNTFLKYSYEIDKIIAKTGKMPKHIIYKSSCCGKNEA